MDVGIVRYLMIAVLLGVAPGADAQLPAIMVLSGVDSVEVKFTDPAAYQVGTNVNYLIRRWPDNAVLAQGQVPAGQVTTDALGYRMFRLQGLNPRLWSPENPHLYFIRVTRTDGSLISETRFGFRRFEIVDRKFHLNGRPIFLRSNPINPPGRDLPSATGKDPAFIRGYLKLVKDAGVNLIRTETQEWLDMCDEVGIMVSQGHYGSAPGGTASTPPPLEPAKLAYRDIVRGLANHPSVVIYYLTNEVSKANYKTFLGAIHADLKLFDPTRPVIGNAGFGYGEGGDIYDIHRYSGWYYGNLHDWYDFKNAMADADAAGQPLTISECVAAYTSDAGVFQTVSKQLSTILRWSGPVVDQRAAALEYQAELTRHVVEIGRRQRTSQSSVTSIMPFTYFFGWASATKVDDLIIKPAYDVLKVVFQPVLISPECWKRNLYAGDDLRMRLCVANDSDDGRDLGPCTAIVDVVDSRGDAVASGQAGFASVAYYTNAWADLSIPLPSSLPRGDYDVRLRLLENGSQVSGNSFRITVAPRDWPKLSGVSVVLYDPDGGTATALEQLGVQFTRVHSLSSLPQQGVLVLGERAFCTSRPSAAQAFAFMERGGRILCLRQTDSCWNSDWLPARFTMSAYSRQTYIHPVGGNEAIFRELRDRDFRLWNEVSRYSHGGPTACPVISLLWPVSHEDLASARVWAAAEQLLSGGAIIEVFHGAGSALISQFRCVERVNGDPIAAKLLSNLISYASSDYHPGRVDLTVPVKWDLEAFRTGVFCSKVQGFFPHSPVYTHTGTSKGQLGADHAIDGFTLIGNYDFNRFGWVTPVPDPAVEGWGVVYGTLSRPVEKFRLKVRNPSTEPAPVRLRLDGQDMGAPATVPAGQERVLEWQANRGAGPVKLELRGDQDLIITESRFE